MNNPEHPDDLDNFAQYDARLPAGSTLANRYSVQEVIGVGGMGAVYRARDLHFPNVNKWVAVKEMINTTRDPAVREATFRTFEREANILATLSHPSIPRIYDFFTQEDQAFLVLEYIHGDTLEGLLRRSPEFLAADQVARWAVEICDVLHFLHSHQPEPIVFRDLKPSNMMINQYQHVVLIDFGIARNFRTGLLGTMMGTEGYSPPEQYRGEATPLSDLYALGATLHHLLTKRNPQQEAPFTFSGRPIREINPAVPPALEDVVNRALAYLPQDRFASAEEMRQALQDVLNQHAHPAGAPHIPNGARPPIAREPAGFTERQLSQAAEERGKVQPVWTFACEDEVRGAPVIADGVLYVGAYDNNLYALEARTGGFLWKFPTFGGIAGRPAVADGLVCFGSEDHYLYRISGADGRMLWRYSTGGPVRSSPRLGEDYLFVGSDDGFVHAVNMRSGQRLWRFDSGAPVRSTPYFLDNLIYFGNEAGDFYCLNLFGEVKWRHKSRRAITSSPVVANGLCLFTSMDGNLYAIDAAMGWQVWRYRMEKGSISSPAVSGGLVYFGAVDGKLYAVELGSGREVWSFRTGHQVTASPLAEGGWLFCGSVDASMYCLEGRTGRLQWKYTTGGPITGGAAFSDGMLYFASTDRVVYAIAV